MNGWILNYLNFILQNYLYTFYEHSSRIYEQSNENYEQYGDGINENTWGEDKGRFLFFFCPCFNFAHYLQNCHLKWF